MPYRVDVIDPPPGDPPRWAVRDYTLNVAFGVGSNYDAETVVADRLRAVDPALGARVEFASEHGCFFAYCDSRADADALAAHIAEMVAGGQHPDAVSGDWTFSSAAVRRWDPDDPVLDAPI